MKPKPPEKRKSTCTSQYNNDPYCRNQKSNKSQSSQSKQTKQKEESAKLVNKWEKSGLLEGMENEWQKSGMAVLLENQARQLIDEASRTGTSANSEEWSGVALPLVRRIFGELAAQEFVSVQPMNLPSGLIFYLDFKYGTAQTGNHTENSDVHGNTSGSGDATGGLYGAGKFGYSINDQSTAAQAIHASAASSGNYISGSVSWADVDFEPDLSSSVSDGNGADNGLCKITVSTAAMTSPDKEGIRAFSISGSGFDEFFPAYTKYDSSASTITFIVKKGAIVGPFARLRPGTILKSGSRVGNFVEIKKSNLGKNSKVNHLSYIGDANIGDFVNIGAGTITCNYDGKNKNKTIIKHKVFVGSNSSLVAPVTLNEKSTIGAGSVITKNVKKNSLALTRSNQSEVKNYKRKK